MKKKKAIKYLEMLRNQAVNAPSYTAFMLYYNRFLGAAELLIYAGYLPYYFNLDIGHPAYLDNESEENSDGKI